MKDTTAYKIFHDIDFNKFPWSMLKPIKTHLYPITSLFIVETPYAKFHLDDMVKVTNIDEYCLDDLRPDDIVLDIGACIGSFSLKVHDKVKKVYAVEPIMADRLKRNVEFNKVGNIKVLKFGLGNELQTVNWAGYSKLTIMLNLRDLINMCGHQVDFLKIDCEGAEHYIQPEELEGIRRIEAEVHKTKNHECYEFINTLISAGFRYEAEYIHDEDLMIVHAYNKTYVKQQTRRKLYEPNTV